MLTARTTQILDSNNNNISPATCIESLYFEMTANETRYRMSLRSRILVADNTLNWEQYSDVDTENDKCQVPFTYVKAVEGTDNMLWQLTAGTYDLRELIQNYINTYVDENYVHSSQQKEFFHRNGSTGVNTISTNVVMTSTKDNNDNIYLTLGRSGEKTGLMWKSHNAEMTKDAGGNLTVATNASVIMSGNTLDATAFNYVRIGNNDSINGTAVNIAGKTVALSDVTNSSLSISGGNVRIGTAGNVTIDSGDIITLNAHNEVRVPQETSLYIYNEAFPAYKIPEIEGTYKYLTMDTAGVLEWTDVEKVSVIPADGQPLPVNTFAVKNLQFDENSKVALVVDSSHPEVADVRLKNFVDSSQNNVSLNLLADNDNKSVYFATINGNPIIGNSALNPADFEFVRESDEVWKNLKKPAEDNTGGSEFVSGITFNDGRLSYTHFDGITYDNAEKKLTTSQFVMNESDERLKTDVRDIEYDGDLPEIVQFRWKDTSALQYGVIAQDVERCGLDTLVRENQDTGMKAVSYTELLLLYIKDLQERNKSLEGRVRRLERLH